MKKTLEVLNSFSKKCHVDPSNMLVGCDVAKAVLELGATQNIATKMDLSGRLLGSLPVSLGHNFDNLVSLDLSKNQLKDLPSSIRDLESLEVLDLQSNQLSSLPDAIGFLENLMVLNVSGNMLVALPDSLGGCRKLMDINAGFNLLEHLPARIGFDLQSLQNLCVHSNKLTYLPASVCEMKQLKFLDLHFNSIKTLPTSLGNLSALEKLNISNNFSDFGGSLPDSLVDLVFLVELDVSFNQIRVLPDWVGALENLKVLKVDNNPLVIPPPEIVSRGIVSVLEFMSMRWRTSQTVDQKFCASPKVSFRGAACTGSSLVSWFSGRRSGRHALPSVAFHGKQISGCRS